MQVQMSSATHRRISRLLSFLAACQFAGLIGAQEAPDHEVHIHSVPAGVELRALVMRPDRQGAVPRRPAVVIAHGGGWTIGEPEWGLGRARSFVELGMVAISLEYRLTSAETGVTPLEAMADIRAGIRWVRSHSRELGIDPEKVAAYGWSAGAHLLASAAIFDDADGEQPWSCSPNALILSSAAVALEGDGWLRRILGDRAQPRDISPAAHVRPGLPPTLLLQGRTDSVTPLAGTRRFHESMLAAGNSSRLIVFDRVGHLFTPSSEPDDGWPNPDPEVRAASFAAAADFLRSLGFVPQ